MKKIPNFKFQISNFRQGFTIVELLVYLGIFAILITAMTQIFVSIIDTQLESEANSSVAQEGQFLYSRLIYDIHNASAIVAPATLGQSGSTLTLTLGGTNYTYNLNGTTLEVTNGLQTYALSGYDTNISNVQFHRLGNVGGKHTVRITFTVGSKTVTKGSQEIRSFQTTAGLR